MRKISSWTHSLKAYISRYLFSYIAMFHHKEIAIDTTKPFDIIDITDHVTQFLQDIQAKEWQVNVFTRHTTAVLKINEAESGLRKDLQIWSDKVIPMEDRYHHNDLPNRDPKTMCASKEECLNGHAHIRSMLLWVSSETIPVAAGKMLLGVRQRILLIEMDHARPRTIICSFMGETK